MALRLVLLVVVEVTGKSEDEDENVNENENEDEPSPACTIFDHTLTGGLMAERIECSTARGHRSLP